MPRGRRAAAWRVGLAGVPHGDPAQHRGVPLYGTLLCTARAMGEFSAVAVVPAKIRDQTTTMLITIEMRYNDYLSVAGVLVAALLTGIALLTLALARAMGIEPRMWLLDQHFRGAGCQGPQGPARHLWQTCWTIVFVTQGQDEAMVRADLVVVMSMGRIEQIGKLQDIRARPATEFVRAFICAHQTTVPRWRPVGGGRSDVANADAASCEMRSTLLAVAGAQRRVPMLR